MNWPRSRTSAGRRASGIELTSAPPSDAVGRYLKMPTTFRRLSPSRVTSPTVAPTSTSALSAVSSSSAISPVRWRECPLMNVPGSKRAGGVEKTSGGAPPVELTALGRAVVERRRASRARRSRPSPRRRRAPSTCASTESGNGAGKPRLVSLTVRSSTTTSFLALAASKMSLNARSIWPVSTNVPEIIATPSRIESAVRGARRGRERRPANVRPSIARYSRDLIRSRISSPLMAPAVRDDQPVAEEQHAVGDRGGARVMRDDHDRLPELGGRLAQQVEDLGARLRVEVAGRLVGEDDGGLVDQRAGDRDALLLAARELRGLVAAAVAEPDAREQARDPAVVGRAPGELERQLDVLPASASAAG